MNIKFACCLLLTVLVVFGCSPVPDDSQPIVLPGRTLEELGLELNVDRLQRFEDHQHNLISYDLNHYKSDHKYAKTTGLVMEFTEKLGRELLICLQGFKKPASSGAPQLYEIGASRFQISDLSQYKLYEDDEVIVFDVTDFLDVDKFDDKVQAWLEKGLPYEWMSEVYDYIRSYEDVEISRSR